MSDIRYRTFKKAFLHSKHSTFQAIVGGAQGEPRADGRGEQGDGRGDRQVRRRGAEPAGEAEAQGASHAGREL